VGDVGQPHFAVFELAEPIAASDAAASDAASLRVSLEFKDANSQTALGRFRLSAIGDPLLLGQVKKRLAAKDISDPWQKLAVVYQLEGQQQVIDQLVERRPQLAGRIGAAFSQNEDWSRAVEIFSRGITPATTDAELLSRRALAYEALQNWEAAAADWTRAATGNPNGAKLLADFALRLANVEQLPLSRTVRQNAQEMLEQALQTDPGDAIVAEQLAELLLSASPADAARLASAGDLWLRLAVGYALTGEAEPANKYFATALDATSTLETEQPIVQEASRFESILAALHEQRPHDSLLQLAGARHLAKLDSKHLAEQRPADAQRGLEQSRELFTGFLADHPTTEWIVATVESAQSVNGATLSKLADGSILASGHNPDQDTFTVRLQTDLSQAEAIRLEPLPDDSLPNRDSGRSSNFNLTGITVHREPIAADGSGQPIQIQSAWVDYSDRDSGGARDGADGIIDSSDQTHWSVHPRQHEAHEAILQFAGAVDLSGGATLTVQLHFQQKLNLGSDARIPT
jgi:tetratricopeptide (TPR) repeat protein